MPNNKVLHISNVYRRSIARKAPDKSNAARLLNGFNQLSKEEQKTMLTLMDAFLQSKNSSNDAG